MPRPTYPVTDGTCDCCGHEGKVGVNPKHYGPDAAVACYCCARALGGSQWAWPLSEEATYMRWFMTACNGRFTSKKCWCGGNCGQDTREGLKRPVKP
jgi:hypothetical protein